MPKLAFLKRVIYIRIIQKQNIMGEVLIIVGFLIGCYGGCMLSLPSVIVDAEGKASKKQQSKFAIVIVIGSLMVLAGQYIMVSPYSY
jgi:hypothetical protein